MLCTRLHRLACTLAERGEAHRTSRLHHEIGVLRKLTAKKLDWISAYLCQHAEADADGNMKVQSTGSNIDYGLWVNIARQPRTKEVDYPEIGVKLEIPRQLALAYATANCRHCQRHGPWQTADSGFCALSSGILQCACCTLPTMSGRRQTAAATTLRWVGRSPSSC